MLTATSAAPLASLANLSPGLLIGAGILALAELVLDVIALVDLYRRPASQVALGNKWVWVVLIILINLIGSILYLAVGRTRGTPPAQQAPSEERRGSATSVADALYGTRDETPPR